MRNTLDAEVDNQPESPILDFGSTTENIVVESGPSDPLEPTGSTSFAGPKEEEGIVLASEPGTHSSPMIENPVDVSRSKSVDAETVQNEEAGAFPSTLMFY
ncbi:unnamed protein product [Calypogeia fissa]